MPVPKTSLPPDFAERLDGLEWPKSVPVDRPSDDDLGWLSGIFEIAAILIMGQERKVFDYTWPVNAKLIGYRVHFLDENGVGRLGRIPWGYDVQQDSEGYWMAVFPNGSHGQRRATAMKAIEDTWTYIE